MFMYKAKIEKKYIYKRWDEKVNGQFVRKCVIPNATPNSGILPQQKYKYLYQHFIIN